MSGGRSTREVLLAQAVRLILALDRAIVPSDVLYLDGKPEVVNLHPKTREQLETALGELLAPGEDPVPAAGAARLTGARARTVSASAFGLRGTPGVSSPGRLRFSHAAQSCR